ncbi:MAG: response regulator [Kofleriaceae bacterium]
MLRILIVDDYEDNGTVLAAALEARGHVVAFVQDAASALEQAAAFRPDVAILDILLPDMNGYELGRRLHRTPGLERLCLIAMTGFSRDPSEARAAGFHGHVMKPVTLATLEATIEECLALAGGVPS